jgi:hypothetical protein
MPESTIRTRMRRASARGIAVVAAASALFGGAVALAPAALAAAPETGAITIAAPASVTAGDTFDVTISAPAATDLFAYELTIGFDPALISYDDATGSFPDGGFDSVSSGSGTVSFTHTRLGTSPGLTGSLSLITFSFTALTDGLADIDLESATFISSTSETATLGAPVTATTTVVAAPTPEPSATPEPSGTPEPSATPTPSTSAEPASSEGSGPLATTGADAAVWIIAGLIAAAVIGLGVVLVLRRRAVTR